MIDVLTNHGWTPLFAAAGRGMVEEARFFLDHGADPNWQIPATSTLKDTGGYPMVAAPRSSWLFSPATGKVADN
ncbi:MAG: ankyrin repeat domain-containing protein [Rhodobacteraceae bacterium]|nr:ankyrin repeat domain-containing protein [Paracoccaceae bacterium]